MRMTIGTGVRPDIVNESLLIPSLEEVFGEENVVVIHSGQHYSYELDKIFYKELDIRKPDYFLEIGSGQQGYQSGEVIRKAEEIMLKEKPDLHISFSDANPSLMAVAASKNLIKVAHIESGMRSFDWRMPEEKNRRMVDHISDILFSPTEEAKGNLLNEGISKRKINVSGKLIADVIQRFGKKIDKSKILKKHNLKKKEYIFVELHRPENVENIKNLLGITKGIQEARYEFDKGVFASFHPRTQDALKRFNLPFDGYVVNPLGMFDFEKLIKNCFLMITDSGTAPETASIYGVPTVTVRYSTERPETVTIGTSVIAGNDDGTFTPRKIVDKCNESLNKKGKNPYKTGATEFIVDRLYDKKDWIENRLKVDWND